MRQKGFTIAGLLKAKTKDEARGRLAARKPLAIIDIGSNSVRQVVYEGLTRAPSILFNEKVLCGLGTGVARANRLEDEAVERALRAIRRFRQLGIQLGVSGTHILATAAVREAENGEAFIEEIYRITGCEVSILSGRQEAEYAALGIKAGFYRPEGIAGDLGGGSTEIIEINGNLANGVTTPLGGLRLAELSGGDPEKARKIVRKNLDRISIGWPGEGRTFYAIGGTWRSLARLHMLSNDYPLEVIHAYSVKAKEYARFCRKVATQNLNSISGIEGISRNRRDLLPYGAVVMEEILNHVGAEAVATSSVGLREGYLFSLLDEQTAGQDALLEATAELAVLRARSPRHGRELAKWTDIAVAEIGLGESASQRRWRIASCNVADIVWRSASDFRAEQTLGIINNAGFNSISHEGRAYLALVGYHRYQGLGSKQEPPALAKLAGEGTTRLARVMAGMLRVLYLFSAGEAGVVPRLELRRRENGTLVFLVPEDLMDMVGEKPENRIEQLARELGEEISVVIGN